MHAVAVDVERAQVAHLALRDRTHNTAHRPRAAIAVQILKPRELAAAQHGEHVNVAVPVDVERRGLGERDVLRDPERRARDDQRQAGNDAHEAA